MSKTFVQFGTALLDPDLIGAVSIKAVDPFEIVASVGFQQATVPYTWNPGIEPKREVLRKLVQEFIDSLPNPEKFVAVGALSWVNVERVQSITWDGVRVTAWLNLPGATLPVRFDSAYAEEDAKALVDDIIDALFASALARRECPGNPDGHSYSMYEQDDDGDQFTYRLVEHKFCSYCGAPLRGEPRT
jgi:hypothetical protein